MNRVDIGFKTSTESQQDGILEANLSSSNARMGGCFNLILQKALNKEEQDVIKVVDLNLTLEQIWIIKGERGEFNCSYSLPNRPFNFFFFFSQ